MSSEEIREYLARNYEKGAWFATSRNETFRRKLYDEYLGGLDMEKFPVNHRLRKLSEMAEKIKG